MIKPLWLLLALLAVASASPIVAAPPIDLRGCRIGKLWDFHGGADGWRADHNVGDFHAGQGALAFRNTGPDPWIINTDVGIADVSPFHFLGIRMRSNRSGSNQIYFVTDRSPAMGEDKVLSVPVIGDGEYHTYVIDMSALKTWAGKLTTLRIDPVNGGEEIGAHIDIDWIAIYQTPAELSMGRPYAGIDGDRVMVSIPITNVGGEPFDSDISVRANGSTQTVRGLQSRQTSQVIFALRKSPSPIVLSATSAGKLLLAADLVSPVSNAAHASSDGPSILRIPDHAPFSSIGVSPPGGGPGSAGELRPLATLAYRDKSGTIHYMELSADKVERNDQTVTMRSTRLVVGGTATFTWEFSGPSVTVTMTSTARLDVLRFEGPRFLVGEGSFGAHKTHALFPGLEYLEADEPSSALRHIGPKFADRHVPHPYKVTIPFMAVENAGTYAGLRWNPMSEWAPGQKLPCAEFESPSRSPGASNHMLSLFVPSIPHFMAENADLASTPFALQPGKQIRLSMTFFAGNGTITDAVAKQVSPNTPLPPISKGVEGTIANCMTAFTESLYSAKANGWKYHIGLHQTPGPNPMMAALVLSESLRKGDPDLAKKCRIRSNTQLAQYTGTTLDWFLDGRKTQVDAIVAQMSPDGGFPYTISPDMVKKVEEFNGMAGTDAHDLGEIGKTNSGLIAAPLLGILSCAVQTGGDKCIQAALKGLERLNSFTVPRGAQGWEVHVHAPDVYAAGLAIDCNLAGYELTGDERYLDRARFWALTGIPFIYSWVPPINPVPAKVLHMDDAGEGKALVSADPSLFYDTIKRQINPGASIAVFGTSFYIVNWFGVPVQWCGISYADAARRYLKYRPNDALITHVADSVFASATQQQFEKGLLAGTFTDSWDLQADTTSPVCIMPGSILDYAYYLIDEKSPSETRIAGFPLRGQRAVLNSYAIIQECKATDAALEATLKHFAGQDVWSCITRSQKPSTVSVDGKTLTEATDLRNAQSGFWFDPANGALHIKYRASKRTAVLRVAW